jgi:basic membrane protein A and related proteins
MRMPRAARAGALLLAIGLVLAGCGGGGDDAGDSGGGGDAAEAKKVGLAFDVGGRGDLGFNDSAYKGITEAKTELGDKFEFKDVSPNADGSNRKELIDGFIGDDYGLVIGVGFAFTEDMVKAATENPEAKFAVVDGFDELCLKPDSNLRCLGFKEQEGSFLMGVAAAMKTKTNTVGFVGGQKGDLIGRFQAGYQAGVEWVNKEEGKNVKVLVDYAGTTVQAFQDPAKGRELATKQIGQGADVLFHAAGASGNGMIDVCRERKKLAIGVDQDQSLTTTNPANREWILTSMLKRVDNSVKKSVNDYVNGTFTGAAEALGLKEGGVDYAQNEYNKELLGDLPATLDKVKQEIIAGTITVPDKPAAS